jgi:hypothetical protein
MGCNIHQGEQTLNTELKLTMVRVILGEEQGTCGNILGSLTLRADKFSPGGLIETETRSIIREFALSERCFAPGEVNCTVINTGVQEPLLKLTWILWGIHPG